MECQKNHVIGNFEEKTFASVHSIIVRDEPLNDQMLD